MTVTVTGSGFGTKPTAAPLVWDNGSGTNIFDKWSGAWPDQDPTYNATYRAPFNGVPLPDPHDTQYIAGSHYGTNGADGGYNVIVFKDIYNVTFPYYIYASWYQNYAPNWIFTTNRTDNNKNFAYSVCCGPYGDGSGVAANWYTGYAEPALDNATTAPAQWGINDDGTSLQFPDDNGNGHYWNFGTNPFGRWLKIEVAMKLTPNSDGYVNVWENGKLMIGYAGPTDKYSGNNRTVGIGGYAVPFGEPNNWRYFEDIYLDTSLARVMLGNAPSLAESTIREMQIPTAWSDGSVTFTVNLGQFTSGETAYLYVFNASGVANTVGYPVTIP